ncbi:MAG: PQQ-binding-like beta-propeller repeat protein [Sandaracinaceae bacterium]
MRATACVLSLVLLGCDVDPPPIGYALRAAWRSETFDGCVLASPLLDDARAHLIVLSGDGRVVALDPVTGATAWSVSLPHADGELAHVIATPHVMGDRLFVAWQDVDAAAGDPAAAPRSAHHVAVIDLATGAIDPSYETLTLAASVPSRDGTGDVEFLASNALSRSRLVGFSDAAHPEGLVYVSFGNARDIQPWHGWVFELDVAAWRAGGADDAIASVLLTTPTNDCGTPGVSGSTDMICGGGVWSPAGPLLLGDSLIVPTGNGALDPPGGLYAHTLMRVGLPGLTWNDGCDEALCAGFDPLDVSRACIESCGDLFVPRLRPADPPFDVPDCAGLSFFECYAALDWDLGADTPSYVTLSGLELLVLSQKDGGVSLIDAGHLGTMHDRLQATDLCGAESAECAASWAGMMVTQPVILPVDEGEALAVVASFMPDETHPAGLVGVRVIAAPTPHLERAWSYPARDDVEAVSHFRRHPGQPTIVDLDGIPHVVVVEQGGTPRRTDQGTLHLVRASDGALVHRAAIEGPGQRFARPAVDGRRLMFPDCENGNAGPGWIEAFDVIAAP